MPLPTWMNICSAKCQKNPRGGGQGQNHMGKIHHGSKHSYQNLEVPYMVKGLKMSYKITKWVGHPMRQPVYTQKTILSETDLPTGQEFGYPPQIFTDHTYTAAMTHTDLEGEVKHGTNFVYCEYCNRCGETHCWCFSSNWEEWLDVNYPNSNPSMEIISSPTARKPPAGWSESRCTIIKATDKARPPSLKEEVSTDSGH